jgi:ethanolamine ammonia-lyase small subunit
VGRRRSDTERQVPAPAGPAPSAAANAGEAGGVEGAKAAAALPDCWAALRALTPARLALGRAGASLPTGVVLRFGWDHAQARDAVQRPLDIETLQRDITALGLATLQVASRAPDRVTYLMRPDLGRRLDERYASMLEQSPGRGCDLALVVADGLSSSAVQRHAPAVLEQIVRSVPKDWRLAPVVIVTQARVALGDEIGERLGAALVAVLIGERPGLSSPDSLGIYLTWQPRIGRSDAERNCISNIRPEGLSYGQAAHKLVWLCGEARQMKLSGVGLKDRSDLVEVGATAPMEQIVPRTIAEASEASR